MSAHKQQCYLCQKVSSQHQHWHLLTCRQQWAKAQGWHWHSTNTHPAVLWRHSSMQSLAKSAGKMLFNRLYVSNLWSKQMDFRMLLQFHNTFPMSQAGSQGHRLLEGFDTKLGCHVSAAIHHHRCRSCPGMWAQTTTVQDEGTYIFYTAGKREIASGIYCSLSLQMEVVMLYFAAAT